MIWKALVALHSYCYLGCTTNQNKTTTI